MNETENATEAETEREFGRDAAAGELYRVHTSHLYNCVLCRTDGDCAEGTRLRRAVRAARVVAGAGGAPSGPPSDPVTQVEG
ncbi:hypothetical protein [Streptomyces silvensis]|uniref:Uncharacterized protein n=1 Tax=Streptomyces silvensis TaxID=1765722 RepID=A0A0W7XA46_9ACTN|nr:hypothetical protein [Streptomyces silvensis]KUF19679.1 hypothetical protein AT728_04785 [Streptomyces silvensis]